MPETRYKVTTEGQIENGRNPANVKVRVTALFKAPPDKIARLFSGKRVVIKENLDHVTAIKYQNALKKAGLVCRIVRQDGVPEVKERPASRKIAEAPQTGEPMGDQPIGSATPESKYLANMESAGLKSRLLAGFYTFFFVICLYIPIRLAIAAYLHFKYSDLFNGVENLNGTTGALITQMRQTNAMSSEFETYQAIALILAVLFLIVFVPMRSGKTWGQKKMGLLVVNQGNQIVRGFIPIILRLISAVAAGVTLGAVYLIPIVHPEKKSLADLISGTRQVQSGPLPPRPLRTALFPFALAILLSLAIAYPKDMLLTPHLPTAQEIAAKKTKIRSKAAAEIPDFKITPRPLKPIRDCGPFIILHWQENLGVKAGYYPSFFEGLTGFENSGPQKSLVLQLFKKEEIRVVFTDNGVDVCLREPGNRDFAELFTTEERR